MTSKKIFSKLISNQVLVAIFLVVTVSTSFGQQTDSQMTPEPPIIGGITGSTNDSGAHGGASAINRDEPCAVELAANKGWKPAEKWVWKRICSGQPADFNEKKIKESNNEYIEPLDPKTKDGWTEDRSLSADFLKYILFSKKFRENIPFSGVQIIGAYFKEPIDLSRFNIEFQLVLEKCRFEGDVNFTNIVVGKRLSLNGSYFGAVDHNNFIAVNLISAQVGEHLSLNEVMIKGLLDMGGVQARSVSLDNSRLILNGDIFTDSPDSLKLINAKIDHWMSLGRNTLIKGNIIMDSLQVGQHLFIRDVTIRQKVNLVAAKIGGWLDLGNTLFEGEINASGLQAGHLSMTDSEVRGKLYLPSVQVDGNLDLSNAFLNDLDLSGSTIKGALGSDEVYSVHWEKEPTLNLRNTKVGAFNLRIDSAVSQPKKLDLRGFQYQTIGGIQTEKPKKDTDDVPPGSDKPPSIDLLDAHYYLEWLEKSTPYSPQPYKQLASVLSENGQDEKSDEILYASKIINRNNECDRREYRSCFMMTLQYLLVGFGYNYWHPVILALLLLIAGTIFVQCSEKDKRDNLGLGLAFSFDRLIPLVRLRDKHYIIDLKGWLRYYFYFHQIAGYILGIFIVAGISGLTK